MQKEHRNSSKMYKAVSSLLIVLDVLTVIAVLLPFLSLWEPAGDLFGPLIAAICLCQAYLLWDSKRIVSYLSLAAAVGFFIISIFIFLL